MKMNKDLDELEKFLQNAHGKITIEANGMIPHVSGNLNDAGMLMASFAMLKLAEDVLGGDFDEMMIMFKSLNEVMGYQTIGTKPRRRDNGISTECDK
jgi:hypothetical protein